VSSGGSELPYCGAVELCDGLPVLQSAVTSHCVEHNIGPPTAIFSVSTSLEESSLASSRTAYESSVGGPETATETSADDCKSEST